MSLGTYLLRRRANRGELGGLFNGESDQRKAQARSIDIAVEEIQKGLQNNVEAVKLYNEALPAGSPELATDELGQKVWAAYIAALKEKGLPLPSGQTPPKQIPEEFVKGWAAFVGEWQTVRSETDNAKVLEDMTKRLGVWRDKLRPYIPIAAELPEFRAPPDTVSAGWIAGGAAIVLAAVVGGVYYARDRLKGVFKDDNRER